MATQGDVLGRAFEHVRSTRSIRTWPTVAECLKAVQVVTKETAKPHRSNVDLEWTDHTFARSLEMLRNSEMGHRAAREGWCLGLQDYVRENGKLPSEFKTDDIRENSRFIDRVAAGTERCDNVDFRHLADSRNTPD